MRSIRDWESQREKPHSFSTVLVPACLFSVILSYLRFVLYHTVIVYFSVQRPALCFCKYHPASQINLLNALKFDLITLQSTVQHASGKASPHIPHWQVFVVFDCQYTHKDHFISFRCHSPDKPIRLVNPRRERMA